MNCNKTGILGTARNAKNDGVLEYWRYKNLLLTHYSTTPGIQLTSGKQTIIIEIPYSKGGKIMSKKNQPFHYGEDKLTAGLALEIARGLRKGIIGKKAAKRIDASQAAVNRIIERGEIVYGINTGFGPLCTTII